MNNDAAYESLSPAQQEERKTLMQKLLLKKFKGIKNLKKKSDQKTGAKELIASKSFTFNKTNNVIQQVVDLDELVCSSVDKTQTIKPLSLIRVESSKLSGKSMPRKPPLGDFDVQK